MLTLEIGRKVIIRTVVFHYIGLIEWFDDKEVHLSDASWLAESARWSVTLTTGEVNEVEPYPNGVTINRDTIVDYCSWDHDLPREAE